MKKSCLIILLLMALPYAAVPAADKPAIAYVDLRKVLVESKVGKQSKVELEKLVKQRRSAITVEENKLKAMQEKFQKDQLLMTDAQKSEKQKEFQQRADAFKKMISEANQDVAAKDKEFAAKSIVEIRKLIAEVAKEMNFSLVLEASESGLLYADSALDLTQKVLERYDAKSGK